MIKIIHYCAAASWAIVLAGYAFFDFTPRPFTVGLAFACAGLGSLYVALLYAALDQP